MNAKMLFLLVGSFVHLASTGASDSSPVSAIRFDGYMAQGDTFLFALSETRDGQRLGGRWLTLGASYQGYNLKAFNEEGEWLVLDRMGEEIILKLEASSHGEWAETHADSVAYVASLIAVLEEKTKQYVTYVELPTDITGSIEGEMKNIVLAKKSLAEGRGGRVHVVHAEDGLPMIFEERQFDWDRNLPEPLLKKLTAEDKAVLNARYLEARIHHRYVVYLAHGLGGNIDQSGSGSQPRQSVLPNWMIRAE